MNNQEQWSSKIGFILAAAGSAIGLGAIWKFPYMAGTNGGGVFFLLFILFTILIGTPILLAEFYLGRRTQKDAVSAFKVLAPNTAWPLVGILGVICAFIILSFYSVVGGWILSYIYRNATGQLFADSAISYEDLFGQIIASPAEVLLAQGVFMIITILVVRGGIQNGIEKASTYMMPALFILFMVLVVRSLTLDGAMEGVEFLLKPDWSLLTAKTSLLALGQAFFTLSIGVSIMITYASYLGKEVNLPSSALSVAGMNIFISLLAGLVIFPAVFALGFEPNAGAGLVFVVLPAVFNEIAFGSVFFFVFLLLLLFATLTSAFSILEIVVAALTKGDSDKRKRYTWIAGILIFITGIPSALSFGVFSHIQVFGKSIFDFADFITNSIGMPLGALFISLFVGFRMKKSDVYQEISQGSSIASKLFNIWYFLVKYLAPAAIILIFLQSFGLFE
ncbi:NSS family neurotransmitter:Na+ symporter [Bacillus ectoiniformans]|uniref:sodium-dependent transporter n=1 Tax=Bacillus ectoiniformans TaxID=1494429 RepID=UPI00195AC3D2|nr:sodium-dependent transporter [Bacillus ectoiniformans]MBM7648493.1 NSS family neurotransmitter:Na+ symporter [Bacillus ectoiniformans]